MDFTYDEMKTLLATALDKQIVPFIIVLDKKNNPKTYIQLSVKNGNSKKLETVLVEIDEIIKRLTYDSYMRESLKYEIERKTINIHIQLNINNINKIKNYYDFSIDSLKKFYTKEIIILHEKLYDDYSFKLSIEIEDDFLNIVCKLYNNDILLDTTKLTDMSESESIKQILKTKQAKNFVNSSVFEECLSGPWIFYPNNENVEYNIFLDFL